MSALAGYEYAGAKYQAGLSAKCLGRTFDVESDELSIAPEKIFRTLVLLQSAVELIDATTAADAPAGIDAVDGRFVESLTGTLGWLAECSYAGLLHMGAFYYAAKVVARSSATRLSRISGFRAACSWWLDRAASGRLRGHKRVPLTSIPSLRFALDSTFNLEARAMLARGAALTDAHNVAMVVQGRRVDGGSVRCLQVDAGRDAWAVILDGVAFWGRWLPAQRDWSSGGREFYSPLQIFLRRPELLRDAFVIIGFDNASDALAVCLGRARAAVERRLLTALFEASHDLGVQLAAWWCSRRLNARADELSKCTSPADARRWAGAHGLQLVACDDVRDDYVVGSLAPVPRRA
jgi:hypothetical protein